MISMKSVSLIIFDWDGTLMDSAARIIGCFQKAALDLGRAAPAESRVKRTIGLSLEQAWSRLMPTADSAEIKHLTARYRDHFLNLDKTEMPLYTGVAEGLQRLEDNGYLLAVATSKARSGLQFAMDMSDLTEHFVTTRCADESFSKPHPAMLNHILDYTGLEAEDAVMIGDTTYDLEMAQSAGMHGIGVGYGAHPTNELQRLSQTGIFTSFTLLEQWLMKR